MTTLEKITRERKYSNEGNAEYLERVVSYIRDGVPIPHELAKPIIEALDKAAGKLREGVPSSARDALCAGFGIPRQRPRKKKVDELLKELPINELKGATQTKLAAKLDCHKRTIQKSEYGNPARNRKRLEDISKATRSFLSRFQRLGRCIDDATSPEGCLSTFADKINLADIEAAFQDGIPLEPCEDDMLRLKACVQERLRTDSDVCPVCGLSRQARTQTRANHDACP